MKKQKGYLCETEQQKAPDTRLRTRNGRCIAGHKPDGWYGVTTFAGESQTEDAWRIGVRLYRRGEE